MIVIVRIVFLKTGGLLLEREVHQVYLVATNDLGFLFGLQNVLYYKRSRKTTVKATGQKLFLTPLSTSSRHGLVLLICIVC